MKNILNENPTQKLSGRLLFSTTFVEGSDILHKKILDIGCGFGWFELFALKHGSKSIAAIEISEADLAVARKYLGGKKIDFSVAGALWIFLSNIQKHADNVKD